MAKVTKLNSAEQAAVNENDGKLQETARELAERLTKEVEKYKEKVYKTETQEELDEMEKSIMKEMDEYDEYIRERHYVLPANCQFEGKTFTKTDVAGKIVYFISKMEQTWQYVKGLYDLCMLWRNPNFETIAYGALDSTLRLLDQCKFKGMSEWRDILIVNEYMKPLHEDYAKDTTNQIALAQRHDAIIKQRDLISTVSSTDE